MALPSRPSGGLPARPKPKSEAALPTLPTLPETPRVDPIVEPYIQAFRDKTGREPNQQEFEKIKAFVEKKKKENTLPPVESPVLTDHPSGKPQNTEKPTDSDDSWRVDPKTGKKYKLMPGFKNIDKMTKSSIKNIAANGASMETLRTLVDEDPDFSLDDLNGSADTFLSHLRVPPDKEEQAKLIAERKARQEAYDRLAEELSAEEDAEVENF